MIDESIFDTVAQTKEVTNNDGKVVMTVRGLKLSDIAFLAKDNLALLAPLFTGKVSPMQEVVDNPLFVATVIAYAADAYTPEMIQKLTNIDLGYQVQAFMAIFELTQLNATLVGNVLQAVVAASEQLPDIAQAANSSHGTKESPTKP